VRSNRLHQASRRAHSTIRFAGIATVSAIIESFASGELIRDEEAAMKLVMAHQ
jgi:hypothetical protein